MTSALLCTTHQGWPYRTGDDDKGMNSYGHETKSTAAHHTGYRLRGAEYDRDKPVENIIAGVDSKIRLFDFGPSRSKYLSIINASRHVSSPLVRDVSLSMADEHKYATPKPSQSTKRAISQSTPHPEVRLQPPTPSSTSKFIQKARGLKQELDAEVERSRTAENKRRNIGDSIYTNAEFSSIVQEIPPAHVTPALKKSSGPSKVNRLRLFTVMNTLQGKSEQLENENGICCRSVRERAFREKTLDIDSLRDEVGRLAGEVEVL
ncbi:hypothetical protein EV360DRAFT_76310 [Lentinula raphanica]|nr:hypothetical protein EV360DRAFT_76310 [Lentinula raphanica]